MVQLKASLKQESLAKSKGKRATALVYRRATILSLTMRVYLHSFIRCCLPKMRS